MDFSWQNPVEKYATDGRLEYKVARRNQAVIFVIVPGDRLDFDITVDMNLTKTIG